MQSLQRTFIGSMTLRAKWPCLSEQVEGVTKEVTGSNLVIFAVRASLLQTRLNPSFPRNSDNSRRQPLARALGRLDRLWNKFGALEVERRLPDNVKRRFSKELWLL